MGYFKNRDANVANDTPLSDVPEPSPAHVAALYARLYARCDELMSEEAAPLADEGNRFSSHRANDGRPTRGRYTVARIPDGFVVRVPELGLTGTFTEDGNESTARAWAIAKLADHDRASRTA